MDGPVKRFSARTEQKAVAKWAAELAGYERARAEPRARSGTVVELVQLFIAEKIDTRQSSLQTRYRESNCLEILSTPAALAQHSSRTSPPMTSKIGWKSDPAA